MSKTHTMKRPLASSVKTLRPLKKSKKSKTSRPYDSSSDVEIDYAENTAARSNNSNADSPGHAIDVPDSSAPRSQHGSDADSSASDMDASNNGQPKKRKRHDPTVFATSISKILGTKLSTAKRSDPILSRSTAAATASKELVDARLETRAKHRLRDEKRAAQERGRIRDVLALDDPSISTADVIEGERQLKKIAQRGVVKLFNAVRAAQVKGEQAAREARQTGVVGIQQREEKVTEMSKKGFLELVAAGGKSSK